MTRTRSLLRALALAFALMILAAACAADDGADEGTDDAAVGADPTEADAAEPDAAEEPDAAQDAGAAATGDEPTEDGAVDGDADGSLTIYSGRSEELVGPLIEQFTEATGIDADVRYGDTAELAATILDEGDNSPADVFFAQDAGALGALEAEGLLTDLPDEVLDRVEDRFRSPEGQWVGASGRARVMVYSTELVSEDELPDSIVDLTGEEWTGRVGWAPTNGSFQSFVTGMRVVLGDDETRQWLEDMIANDTQVFENNSSQVEAAGNGEIAIGLVNNYYLPRTLAENPDLPAGNHFLPGDDIGSLINIAGAGLLGTSDQTERAAQFVEFLLTDEAQTYFAEETYEYPLVEGVDPIGDQPTLSEVASPDVDLSDLADLQGTLDLLIEVGAI